MPKNIEKFQKSNKYEGLNSYYFSQEEVNKLMTNSGSVGLRIYYSLNQKGQIEPILVGVDKNGSDVVNNGFGLNEILKSAHPCPDQCPPSKPPFGSIIK